MTHNIEPEQTTAKTATYLIKYTCGHREAFGPKAHPQPYISINASGLCGECLINQKILDMRTMRGLTYCQDCPQHSSCNNIFDCDDIKLALGEAYGQTKGKNIIESLRSWFAPGPPHVPRDRSNDPKPWLKYKRNKQTQEADK